MQAINANLASILATAFRAPRVYALITIPLLKDLQGDIDYTKWGPTFVIDHVLSMRRTNILDPGSDTLDLAAYDDSGDYSPLKDHSTYGRFFYPGAVDNKLSLYMGLWNPAPLSVTANDIVNNLSQPIVNAQGANVIEATGATNAAETVLPKGVYIVDTFKADNQNGVLSTSISAFDNWYMFQGDVYTQFPPRLFGNQQSSYYDPNYALKPINVSGGTATQWVCDCVNWMQSASDNKVWSADYAPVQVYVSTDNNGSLPTTLQYTINYGLGIVTFNTPLSTSATVSVDARPLAMAPEKALTHLFADFGNFDTNSMKFDATGILMPVMEVARQRKIVDVAKDIIFSSAPKGIRWRLYFDENGSLIFTEDATDGAPVKVLTDTEHLLHVPLEFAATNIANVVRATGRCITDQPLEVISFDVTSINTFSQRPTFDVPSQLLGTLVGMDPGSAVAYLNGLTAAFLFEYSTPTMQMELEVLPDPSLQVNDLIWVKESKTGLDNPFMITQIQDEIQGETWRQTLKVEQVKNSQDFMYGLSAYAGVPTPGNPAGIMSASSLISEVLIANTTVVNAGKPVLDTNNKPVVPLWSGGTLSIQITLAQPPSGSTGYVWRWMYLAEDAYYGNQVVTGDGSSSGLIPSSGIDPFQFNNRFYGNGVALYMPVPYDCLWNIDTPRSRRFFRPLMRCSDWMNDGQTGFTGLTTYSSGWTGGVGVTNPQLFGSLRLGLSDFYGNTTNGYSGQALYAANTPAANALGASSTAKYGVDYGLQPFGNNTLVYGINKKKTPAYLCILTANTAGSVQFKRIPFLLSV